MDCEQLTTISRSIRHWTANSGFWLLDAVCSMGEHKVRPYINFLRLDPMMYYRQSYIDYIAMIRNFTPADAEACYRLVRDCIQADRTIPSPLSDKMVVLESPDSMLERSRLFYMAVYESNARIWGIAGLDMNEIRILCVSPEHQRQGIGRSLLNHIVDMVPGILFPDIFVYAAKGAVAFYKAAGFAEKGPMVFDISGEPLQTVFMTRVIR